MDERVRRQFSDDSVAHENTTLESVHTENTRPATIQPAHRQQREFLQDRVYTRDWAGFLLVVFLVVGLMFFGCLTVITLVTRPSAGNYVSRPTDRGLERGEQQPQIACRPCQHGDTVSADNNCCQSDVRVPDSIQKVWPASSLVGFNFYKTVK